MQKFKLATSPQLKGVLIKIFMKKPWNHIIKKNILEILFQRKVTPKTPYMKGDPEEKLFCLKWGPFLRDIPLGSRRTEIGLVVRQAWFLNGCFFNSEVWSGHSDRDLKDLQIIDHSILRLITGAQAKVLSEMLYLETAQLPIINVITVRRLLYLHTILTRHDN